MRRALAGVLVVAAVVTLLAPASEASRANKRRPGPIRVLLVGDSITYFYQDRVQPLLGPDYEVITGGVPGQSLLDENMCDGSRSRALVDMYDPDVVVLEYAGNYGVLVNDGVEKCVYTPYGSQKFYTRWANSARVNQKILRSDGARIVWLQLPVSSASPYDTSIPIINDIYSRTPGRSELLDAWTPFGGSEYNASLHTSDGLHLNSAGSDLLASLVADKVRG